MKTNVKEKFENAEYPIHVIGRHINVTDAMKSYAVDKLVRMERFGMRVVDATIIMDSQKLQHTVDFILNVNNNKIKVSGKTGDMYSAIDQAIDHLQAKLRRYMKRLHDHHTKPLSEIDVNVNVFQGPVNPVDDVNDQIEEENLRHVEEELKPHKVVKKEKAPLKTLTVGEAIMKMDLSDDSFMLFRSEEDRKLKVIYRREEDGNYGVIEPE